MGLKGENKITGLMIYYYFVCHRKLWYHGNGIAMEQNSELVKIGKEIDENTYSREKKHFNINDEINIDFIEKNGVLHEVKKSKAIEPATIWQVKYYLYYLEMLGIENLSGKIDYPILRQTVSVELIDEDRNMIDNLKIEIPKIIAGKIPELRRSRICSKCAYRDLCLI